MSDTRTLSINGADVPTRYRPLWWQKQGLSFTASGYGRRIPTAYMVQLPDARGVLRWRRVYCACFGNSGTCYVEDRSRPKRIREGGTVARWEWLIVS